MVGRFRPQFLPPGDDLRLDAVHDLHRGWPSQHLRGERGSQVEVDPELRAATI
jgi:hypothetical protein